MARIANDIKCELGILQIIKRAIKCKFRTYQEFCKKKDYKTATLMAMLNRSMRHNGKNYSISKKRFEDIYKSITNKKYYWKRANEVIYDSQIKSIEIYVRKSHINTFPSSRKRCEFCGSVIYK